MRYLAFIVCVLLAFPSVAQEWEDQRSFGDTSGADPLRVLSSTDTAFFAPVIESFIDQNAGTAIEYLVTGTADIDRIFRASPQSYDLVVSSAMDLQFKLANDGYSLRLAGMDTPVWTMWRESLFAFTSEPAAIVINKQAFAGHAIPRSRQELIQTLRERPDVFQSRVGTYDVRESGLGYLFATQDARASDTYWRLMEVFGGLNTRLYCCSGDMIDDLSDGTILVAYNVLGSYATARADDEGPIEVILPSDFPTSMMRTVLVSRDSKQPDLAEAFVEHLLRTQSEGEQSVLPLPSLSSSSANGEATTITLGPSLLTYLDNLKRKSFLDEWESAVIQNNQSD